jgi:hypothetical protein
MENRRKNQGKGKFRDANHLEYENCLGQEKLPEAVKTTEPDKIMLYVMIMTKTNSGK